MSRKGSRSSYRSSEVELAKKELEGVDHVLAQEQEKLRDDVSETSNQFSSRWAFWASAIGCSVGFGNVWRFPYLLFEYGGLAFLIPYLIALFVVGIPVTILEFGLGQLAQGGQVKSFRAIHPRTVAVGWTFWTCANILQFYPLLLSWALMYFANSFKKDLPWAVTDEEAASCAAATDQPSCVADEICSWNPVDNSCSAQILVKAVNFFERDLSAKPEYWEGVKSFNGYILLCEAITWASIFACTVGGARILGYINYVTTGAPAIFLILLVIVGATLDGAGEGVKQYVGKFDGATLKEGTVWSDATIQVLFSLGATQGSMTGYSAHNARDQNFVQDAYVVAFGDTLFAIVAGFAVFTVIGYLSHSSGIPIVDLPIAGTGVAFISYPVGLSASMGYPGPQIFSVLFFLTLWLLGMATSVGLIEGICLVWQQSGFYTRLGWPKWYTYATACFILFLFAFLYSTDMGLHFLDCLDGFAGTFCFIFGAGAQAIAVGWYPAWDLWVEKVGASAVYMHFGTFIAGITLGPILGFSLDADVGKIVGPIVGALLIVGGFFAALFMSNSRSPRDGTEYSFGKRIYNLTLYNPNKLRKYMNNIACRNTIWRVPRIWCIATRYVIPLVGGILFFQSLTTPAATYKRPSGDGFPVYPWYVFLMGNITPYVVFFGVLLFYFFPSLMQWIVPADYVEFDYRSVSKQERLSEIRSRVSELRDTVQAVEEKKERKSSKDSSSSSSSSSSSQQN